MAIVTIRWVQDRYQGMEWAGTGTGCERRKDGKRGKKKNRGQTDTKNTTKRINESKLGASQDKRHSVVRVKSSMRRRRRRRSGE